MSEKTIVCDENHQYFVDGVAYNSMSNLMTPLNRLLGISNSDLARARGSALHSAIEVYLKTGGLVHCEAEAEPYFEQFIKWWKSINEIAPYVEIISVEEPIAHAVLGYCGTPDLILNIGGRITIIDYKAVVEINWDLVIPQLSGYKMARQSNGKESEDTGIAVLHLTPTSYRLLDVEYDPNIVWCLLGINSFAKKRKGVTK